METLAATRPEADEYSPYYGKYIELVPTADVTTTLSRQLEETLLLLRSIPEERAGHRYAPDKWSIKELVGHLIDGERIFAYRALRFARGDETPLPGFDQDDYVKGANFDRRPLSELAEELAHVRQSTLSLLRSLDGEGWLRRGKANDQEVSVRALAYIMAGHETHHMRILRERYLQQPQGETA